MNNNNRTIAAFLSGLVMGAASLYVVLDSPGIEENNIALDTVQGVLSTDFDKAVAVEVSEGTVWTKVANVDTNEVWVNATKNYLAVTQEGRAVQLLSYVDGIYYFDIFEAGEPRLTAELSSDVDRLFVYEGSGENYPWVYVDKDFDGVPEQRLQFDVEGSAQDVELTLVARGEDD